ncbi:hypothetical protein [Vitiosangium sp. GDMCC 1.1324]|uniref:hypothetical protein n=1 Tax=Vitiosangium sp. (strain GDMCC 1.1324) TaxID=2138576 RepID=UPI000D335621|nr:hypothetical protein [Vitiosangium sp. GDMCC 1.1324]PTL76838.1 hypothetical protein DAT35_47005 [Vitiosangium sp. GDMCC 1.1324]
MSEGANQPEQPPRGTPSSSNVPRVSQTNLRVMTAARTAPLPKEQQQGPLGQKLKSESANVALNALSIVKEMVQDFRQQDRFFKYKAFIVGGWLLLSVVTFGATCARGVKQTGDFGAKLVPVAGRSSVTIMNKSEAPWIEVTLIVKDDRGAEWRASVARVEPAREVTVSPKQLLGAGGQAAPSDISIRGVEMRTSEGRATLMVDGRNLTDDAQ